MTITKELLDLKKDLEEHISKIRYQEKILIQNREGFLERLKKLDYNLYEDTLKGHYGYTLSSIFNELDKLENKVKGI